MNEKTELVNAVIKTATEVNGKKRLSCAEAFRLAARFGVKVREIGNICNTNEIRICNCQLGCFK